MATPQPDHHPVQVFQTVIRHLFTTTDLARLCGDAGVPVLADASGHPMTIVAAHDYTSNAAFRDATFGVVMELSDGRIVALDIDIRRLNTDAARPYPLR